MAERVRVREIDDDEGRRLPRIVRRGAGSVVTWRRAQMVLLSAQGMDIAAIAEVAFTSAGRVRDVLRNFNTDGFRSLYPKYTGDRPPTFTLPQRREIKKIAKSKPAEHDLPFSVWSLTTNKAVDLYAGPYLPDNPHSWAENASRALDREVVQALTQLAALETEPERAVLHLEKATHIDTTAQHLYGQRMPIGDLARIAAVHHCWEQLTSTPRPAIRSRTARPYSSTGTSPGENDPWSERGPCCGSLRRDWCP
jgi:hypothetical protein